MRRQRSAPPRTFWCGYCGLSCLLALALSAFAITATPAFAITSGHRFAFEFGSPGTANGQFASDGYSLNLGVDQSTGDVYVADSLNYRIQKFDAAGNFLQAWGYGVSDGEEKSEVCVAPSACKPGIPGAAPGQLMRPDGIAVDNSGGPNDGDVYVVDSNSPFYAGRNEVLKFSENGTFLNAVDGSESPTGKFGFVSAATVDSSGYLWVSTGNNTMEFANDAENEYIGGSEWEGGGYALGINKARSKLYIDNHLVATNGTNPQPPYTDGFGATVNQSNGNVFAFWYDTGTAEIQEYTETGEKVGPPFVANTFPYFCVGAGAGGVAVNEATGTVYEIDACNARVFVFVPRVVPETITGPPNAIGHTSATLTGETTPDPSGGGNVTDCHFEIGSTTSYGTNVPCSQATPYAGHTSVSADVAGLTSDTTYHYRLVTANSVDANDGADRTFTPRKVLGLSTDPATSIGLSSTTLNASFDPGGEDTHYFFEWGPTTAYGHTTASAPGVDAGSGSGSTSVSATITELASYAVYHYRVVASNSLGTSIGNDETVRTLPPLAPVVADSTATELTSSSAHLSATVNPNHGATSYKFQWGTDSTYGHQTPESELLPEDEAAHPAVADLSSLSPGTVYHYRIVAVNLGGTADGPDMTFTTSGPPDVSGEAASGTSATSTTLGAQVNPELSPTTVHFEYGPTTAYGSRTPETPAIGADRSGHPVSAAIGGLAPGTTYHYRAVASNGIAVTYGSDHTFATPAAVSPPPPTGISCKKGYVSRHRKCVKKVVHKKHHGPKRRHGKKRGDG